MTSMNIKVVGQLTRVINFNELLSVKGLERLVFTVRKVILIIKKSCKICLLTHNTCNIKIMYKIVLLYCI